MPWTTPIFSLQKIWPLHIKLKTTRHMKPVYRISKLQLLHSSWKRGNRSDVCYRKPILKKVTLQLGIRDSGFDFGIRYSLYFQIWKICRTYKSIITPNQIQKGKFCPQTVIFRTNKALTYPKCRVKGKNRIKI